MTADKLKAAIIDAVLPDGKDSLYRPNLRVEVGLGACDIVFGNMYTRPPLNLKHLKAIGDLFLTEDVTVDEYDIEGCETCDWGSNYGHTINVRNVGRHMDAIRELAKLDNLLS